ncbi:MAG: hypothetical protein EPO25_10305 [Gammaproteobacteria bacterium]|nr:MAG: hypothetical protein EPO25_10305 [Gammaproteobacteria bacterium]
MRTFRQCGNRQPRSTIQPVRMGTQPICRRGQPGSWSRVSFKLPTQEIEQVPGVASLKVAPDRGRIIIVNFELAGSSVPPEMCKPGRPCVVLQNNKLGRAGLVTVVPLSMTEPKRLMPYHHLMDHRSFRDLPRGWGNAGLARWAKCDYVATVSLYRCVDPHYRSALRARHYVRVMAVEADITAIERCVLWALGIQPARHVRVAGADKGAEEG